ncbi:MAG: hypothetical protein Q8L09_04895 [Candidatus Moranbacteria bacterium]|nr:hypothetical protein [Candidatus Moranbacteria bacterium]
MDEENAHKLLKIWENFSSSPAYQQDSRFSDLVTKLKILAFAHISDEESANILKNNLLDFFEIDAPLEAQLTEKLFLLPYSIRDELRENLKKAVQSNSQNIGKKTIGQWIKLFDNNFDYRTRHSTSIISFLNRMPDASELSDVEKEKLKKILHAYDSLLIYNFPATGSELDDMMQSFTKAKGLEMSFAKKQSATHDQSTRIEEPAGTFNKEPPQSIMLKEALHKFPNLGEQSVTMNPIKLKQFDHPVRPSVRNWLYDYTMQLGQTGHSSMDRTNYLFRSDNAKNLSSPERDKLAIILKSFDESVPLPIDGKRQEIVFESFAKKEAPPQSSFTVPPQPAASISFIHHAERPAAPVQRNISSAPKQQFPPVQRQENSFVRPYPQPVLKSSPPVPSKREISPSMSIPKPPPDEIEYTNPYPEPGTHEMLFEKSNDNIANIRFSEGAPKDSFIPISQVSAKKMPAEGSSSPLIIPARPLAPAAKSAPLSSPPAKPAYRFTPPDRNIIQPHYGGATRSDKPEPKIQGNTVDLREQ